MLLPDRGSLWELAGAQGDLDQRFIADGCARVTLATLGQQTGHEAAALFSGKSVLMSCSEQLTVALGLIALDGVARRIVLLPPDLDPKHLAYVAKTTDADVAISEKTQEDGYLIDGVRVVACQPDRLAPLAGGKRIATEWILFTSGTTGVPKMVVHTIDTLVGPTDQVRKLGNGAVWSTFYDIRRYGGLQILLRSLVAGGSMVLSNSQETTAGFLTRAGAENVSHISGTPSHWRRALMSAAAGNISPRYVRMSGEVADQAIIDALRSFYPQASVAHAFASTEAGLAFEVNDGQAGFPAHFITDERPGVTLRIREGSLQIRSIRTASGYLGGNASNLADAEGFIDTGDIVELRNDRYHFVGRREGIINVGGFKVHPEEIEAVINRHPGVQMSMVRARSSPITGAIVVADVVPRPSLTVDPGAQATLSKNLRTEILELCRSVLPAYKVPASISVVPQLSVGASGKLTRVRT